jgi:hypothetical protein
MAPAKGSAGFPNIFRSDQEVGPVDGWEHAAGIVGPDHRFDPDLVQNALGYLSIHGRPERRNGDQL